MIKKTLMNIFCIVSLIEGLVIGYLIYVSLIVNTGGSLKLFIFLIVVFLLIILGLAYFKPEEVKTKSYLKANENGSFFDEIANFSLLDWFILITVIISTFILISVVIIINYL